MVIEKIELLKHEEHAVVIYWDMYNVKMGVSVLGT